MTKKQYFTPKFKKGKFPEPRFNIISHKTNIIDPAREEIKPFSRAYDSFDDLVSYVISSISRVYT